LAALESPTSERRPRVKKNRIKKLALNRETIHALEASALGEAQGALLARPRPGGGTNEISICVYCTTPLDTCPDPTVTIG
jgi:hypothetical protein